MLARHPPSPFSSQPRALSPSIPRSPASSSASVTPPASSVALPASPSAPREVIVLVFGEVVLLKNALDDTRARSRASPILLHVRHVPVESGYGDAHEPSAAKVWA